MAGVVTAGGILGYVQKGSKPSLIAGGGLGACYLGAGLLINKGEGVYGHGLAALASSALVYQMGPKFMATRAVMPAGVLSVLGAGAFAYHSMKFNEWWDW